jgi:hypothetical protein
MGAAGAMQRGAAPLDRHYCDREAADAVAEISALMNCSASGYGLKFRLYWAVQQEQA